MDAFMAALEHPFQAEVEALRAIIKGADSRLKERVKWKAPSYFLEEDMAAFNLRAADRVHIVFLLPKGIAIEDPILEGDYQGRRMIYFKDMAEVKRKRTALERVVRSWVAQAS